MNTHRAVVLSLALLLATLAPLALARPRSAVAQSSKVPSACTVNIREATAREAIPLCEQAEVTVTLGLTCPTRLPFHAVFVVARHLLMQDHLDDAKAAARGAADEITFFPDTQVAVVSLSVQERVEQDLTNKQGSVLGAISRIKLDNVNPTVEYYDWLGQAGRMLGKAQGDAPAPPIEAVILYSTGCPTGFDSYCNRQIGAAGSLKSQGITVIGVCNPNARPFGIPLPNNHCRYIQQVASDGYYFDLQQGSRVNEALVDLQNSGNNLKAKQVLLSEWLAPGLSLVAGSGMPAPEVHDQELRFAWQDVAPGTTLTATWRAQAGALGRSPLRTKDSRVKVTDNLDHVSEPIPVPLRAIEIVPCAVATPTPSPTATPAPTATPTPLPATATPEIPPTATATRMPPTATRTATAAPSPTSEPGVAFLPIAMNRVCKPAERPSEVVLLVDTSSSMGEVIAGTTKLAAAQASARRFVEIMNLGPGADRAAVVAFNSEATVAAPLTHDREALRRAIDGVAMGSGTRIDRAIERGAALLGGGDPAARKVIVLLTDGRPDGGTVDGTLAAAAAAKAGGATLFTIGLGDGVDADLLRRLASAPDSYFQAPDAAALRAIYESLAAALPCPGGAEWGGR